VSPRIDSSSPLSRVLLPAALIATILLAYSNSFTGTFLLDDFQNIVRNPNMGSLFRSVSNSSRPVTNATFFLNHRLGGLRAADYHAVNLLIHVVSALLLFGIVRGTLTLPHMAVRLRKHASALAATVACVWAVHPLQTAAVTYIVQRAESLMSMLYLLTVYLVVVGHRSPHPHRWHTAAVIACAIGMATKPTMVSAPLLVLLYDMTFLSGGIRQSLKTRRNLYILLACTWLVLLALVCAPNESSTSTGVNSGLISPLRYLITEVGVITHYLILIVNPTGMCLDYAWPVGVLDARTAAMLTGLALSIVFGIWLQANRNYFGFLVLAFFLSIAPSSSIIPVADYAFDHRMYLPSIGAIAALVCVVYVVLQDRIRASVLGALALAAVGALSCMTYARNMDYQTEERMWQDVVSKRPANLRARNNLAVALSERKAFEDAMACYVSVLQMIPDEEREKLDRGEVIPGAVIPANSARINYFRAHANLGLLHYRVRGDRRTALQHYNRALGADPLNTNIRTRIDRITRELAVPEVNEKGASSASENGL